MDVGRRVRFTAVLVAVVFALTGFSSSGGSGSGSSGKSKSKSSSGGGCSSSKSKKKTHSSGSGSSATPSPSRTGPPAHAVVVTCAGPGRTEATVKVTSDVDAQRTVKIPVIFQDAQRGALDTASVRVTLKARETKTVTVALSLPNTAAQVKNCTVGTIEKS
ncbi:hypothetical protein OG264_17265 [Streptomyces xanthophaeus]|uniref:hypothetical protein n=1 Tax=Streptomyces xanthophaeus TaxID=67385 RepID=UPI0038670097|nr:hypothetical protein OG264_17265 [Streptomyces xanthophaeus]WST61937.1 hypothetical protein OG605_21170 [Streptomyces xanthophaeus]